jgi:hypothetical protein
MSDQSHAEALATARINIARLEVQVSNLSQGMADLQESNQQLTAKLDQVLLTLSEARGGWKTLMAVGGAAASAGALASWIGQHVKW